MKLCEARDVLVLTTEEIKDAITNFKIFEAALQGDRSLIVVKTQACLELLPKPDR